MLQKILANVQQAVRNGDYHMTHHSSEEMAEDELTIFDIESALLNGRITRKEKGFLYGPKYTIKGRGTDAQTEIAVIGRFTETKSFLIITLYKLAER